ncbi:hypothetical protein KIPB_005154 [Kipferlia bialata]|uniref:Uncharacterized protein n=1 Tax=Kipferlia bialata TaxID=797122 RepID=A0A9K3CWS7_9EUKA|nr:hypothetical protein KIPB_005154 [Kipferlia bialata]|eukprot:g5154.t1
MQLSRDAECYQDQLATCEALLPQPYTHSSPYPSVFAPLYFTAPIGGGRVVSIHTDSHRDLVAGDQGKWLEATLSAHSREDGFLLAMMHKPAVCAGSGIDLNDGDYHHGPFVVRTLAGPDGGMGADIALEGHVHSMQAYSVSVSEDTQPDVYVQACVDEDSQDVDRSVCTGTSDRDVPYLITGMPDEEQEGEAFEVDSPAFMAAHSGSTLASLKMCRSGMYFTPFDVRLNYILPERTIVFPYTQ